MAVPGANCAQRRGRTVTRATLLIEHDCWTRRSRRTGLSGSDTVRTASGVAHDHPRRKRGFQCGVPCQAHSWRGTGKGSAAADRCAGASPIKPDLWRERDVEMADPARVPRHGVAAIVLVARPGSSATPGILPSVRYGRRLAGRINTISIRGAPAWERRGCADSGRTERSMSWSRSGRA